MATVHRGYRLDEGLVARIDAWADARGLNQADAVRQLLTASLDADSERERANKEQESAQAVANTELRRLYGDHIRDLRQQISTQTAQLAEKDEQLRSALELANHAQALQAASVQRQLLDTTGAVDAQQDVEHQETGRPSWRKRVARWLAGERG